MFFLRYHIIDKPGCWKTVFWVHTTVHMVWVNILSSIKVIQNIKSHVSAMKLEKQLEYQKSCDNFSQQPFVRMAPKPGRGIIIAFSRDGAWYFFELKVCLVSHQESLNFIQIFIEILVFLAYYILGSFLQKSIMPRP